MAGVSLAIVLFCLILRIFAFLLYDHTHKIGTGFDNGFPEQGKAGQSGAAAQVQDQSVNTKGTGISLHQLLQNPQAVGTH
jgi:hypothetical protein